MVNTQAYRSGHNEAVLKTVWVKAHGGSNPSACATHKRTDHKSVLLCVVEVRLARFADLSGVRARSEKRLCCFILSVRERRRFGDSQSPSACARLSVMSRIRRGIRGWEPFCESKTLCRRQLHISASLTAKATINNCRAGRAAKGENPSAYDTKRKNRR